MGPREQQSKCLQKTSQCFTDSRMCWWGPQLLCLMDKAAERSPRWKKHCIHQFLIIGLLHTVYSVKWSIGPIGYVVAFSGLYFFPICLLMTLQHAVLLNYLIGLSALFTKVCAKPQGVQLFAGRSSSRFIQLIRTKTVTQIFPLSIPTAAADCAVCSSHLH